MKKFRYQIIITALLAFAVISCKKDLVERFTPERMFTPTEITVRTVDTSVVISWPSSLFSAGSGVTYTLQISEDSTFQAAPALSFIVDSTAAIVTDDSLKDRTSYFARVKANATNAATESAWVEAATHFSLVGVQIFQSVQSSDILDDEVILHWTTTEGVDKIVITAPNGDTTQVSITDANNTAGQVLISGLTGSTQYTAEIFAGTKSKGLVTFTTKASLSGNNIIDLRNITDRPDVLFDTLSQVPEGSIILLKRGLSYTISSSYVFKQSVSIMSGIGFGEPAILQLASNFDASGNIDSLQFSDLTITTIGATYFMNVGNAAVINKMNVSNCTTQGVFNNSFIRLKTAGDEIKNLIISNCIIDSFGIGAKYAVLYANAGSSAVIDNIDIQNSTFYSFYYFIRQDGVAGTSLNINNCTFNSMINQGGYFVNYSGKFPGAFNISNTIFGSTIDPTNANGIKPAGNAVLSNTYATSDNVFSANPITGATSYSGTAADLFEAPANGNFTIKDNSFAGKSAAGDPRWR